MSALVLIVLAIAYFVPAIVASARGHHNAGAIAALNILLGWLLIPWVIALVWGLTEVRRRAPAPAPAYAPPVEAGGQAVALAPASPTAKGKEDVAALVLTLGLALVVATVLVVFGRGARERSAERDTSPTGHWHMSSLSGGSGDVGAVLTPTSLLGRKLRGQYAPELNVACRDNVTSVWVRYGPDAVLIGTPLVTWGVDSHRVSDRWRASDSGAALGLWTGREAIPLARRLASGQTFAIIVDQFEGGRPLVYRLNGGREAIAPIAEACGWSLDPG